MEELDPQHVVWIRAAEAVWDYSLVEAERDRRPAGNEGYRERADAIECYEHLMAQFGLNEEEMQTWENSLSRAKAFIDWTYSCGGLVADTTMWDSWWCSFAKSLQDMVFFCHLYLVLNGRPGRTLDDPTWPTSFLGHDGGEWFVREGERMEAIMTGLAEQVDTGDPDEDVFC